MCQAAYFTDPTCECRWMEVIRPCGPGMGFTTCDSFFTGIAKPQPLAFKTTHKACPTHDLWGNYDHNVVRRVMGVHRGMRWGSGPNKVDMGVECACVIL